MQQRRLQVAQRQRSRHGLAVIEECEEAAANISSRPRDRDEVARHSHESTIEVQYARLSASVTWRQLEVLVDTNWPQIYRPICKTAIDVYRENRALCQGCCREHAARRARGSSAAASERSTPHPPFLGELSLRHVPECAVGVRDHGNVGRRPRRALVALVINGTVTVEMEAPPGEARVRSVPALLHAGCSVRRASAHGYWARHSCTPA